MKLSSRKTDARMTLDEMRKWLDEQDAIDKASLDWIHILFDVWLLNIEHGFHQHKRTTEELIEILIKEYWGQDAKAFCNEQEKTIQLTGSQGRIVTFGK